MSKRERSGKADVIVGRAKEATGVLTGDKSLERAGAKQQSRGKFRERMGWLRKKLVDALENAASAIKK